MRLHIQVLNEKHSIEVNENETIFNIKKEIGKTIFFDENTHLTFQHERLIDDKTLSHYKITNDNTIFVNKTMQINKDSKSMFKIVNGRCCGG